MTFNKMRSPIVWITLALCVVLCAIAVNCGPVDNRQDQGLSLRNVARSARDEPYDDEDGEDDGDEDGDEEGDGGDEGDDDGDDGDDDGDGDGDDDGVDDEEDGRSLKRKVRDAEQRPLAVDLSDEDSVIPFTDAPVLEVTTKKPSVLLLLSNALDKAIAATTKLPTQQMASDAAGIFVLLGQVFSEAIDKVIGEDGPEDTSEANANITPEGTEIPQEELTLLPISNLPAKVEKQQDFSQNDKVIFST